MWHRDMKWAEAVGKSPRGCEDIVSRILMAFEVIASEGWKKSKENVIGNWRKEDPYYVVTRSLVTQPPVVMWKVENITIN